MLSGLSGLLALALPYAAEGVTTMEAAPSFGAGGCAIASPLAKTGNSAAATRALCTHSIRFIRLSLRSSLQAHFNAIRSAHRLPANAISTAKARALAHPPRHPEAAKKQQAARPIGSGVCP
jgi:hypothetical protein